jgi:hypothetical protein
VYLFWCWLCLCNLFMRFDLISARQDLDPADSLFLHRIFSMFLCELTVLCCCIWGGHETQSGIREFVPAVVSGCHVFFAVLVGNSFPWNLVDAAVAGEYALCVYVCVFSFPDNCCGQFNALPNGDSLRNRGEQ